MENKQRHLQGQSLTYLLSKVRETFQPLNGARGVLNSALGADGRDVVRPESGEASADAVKLKPIIINKRNPCAPGSPPLLSA